MSQLSTPTPAPAIASAEEATPSRMGDYFTLTKPRITALVVMTAFIGYAMGAGDSAWHLIPLLGTLVGTALSCMGAGAFNQLYERDTDALMERTSHRPVAAGRLPASHAAIVGVVLSILGVALLAATSTWLAALVSAFTIFSYVLIYTPMKRTTSFAVWVGAVPGALPPVIGYTAATGRVGVEAVLLFAIMFVWQIPHFLAIAWLYRDDYARAGFPMLPVIHPDGESTFLQILATCLALLPLGLVPSLLGVAGGWYFLTALVCGLLFLVFAVALVANPTRSRARQLFFASLIYLPVVLLAMPIDRA